MHWTWDETLSTPDEVIAVLCEVLADVEPEESLD
jgi:hypothetical protein